MKSTAMIRKAAPADVSLVVELLRSEDLPTEDLRPDLENFWIAVDAGQAVGLIGLDLYPPVGLLRSMLVIKTQRNKGLASRLIERLETRARELELTTLFLITNTAENYFRKKGFTPIPRSAVPDAVAMSGEMNGLCPASSVIMRKPITQQ